MNVFDLIAEKVAYNQWANQKLIEWLQQQPSELFEKEVVSSFASVNKLIHHIMGAQKYYFSILQDKEVSYEKVMTTEKIFRELLKMDEEFLAWLLLQNPVFVNQTFSLKRSPIVETYTTATLITHVVNHSTYHRGQLLALRHQLNLSDAPKTDYYRFIIASEL